MKMLEERTVHLGTVCSAHSAISSTLKLLFYKSLHKAVGSSLLENIHQVQQVLVWLHL